MSMDKLIADVKGLIEEEYGRASIKFGATNNSDHESYAVLLEEVQEAQFECKGVDLALSVFWEKCKKNDTDEYKLDICRKLENRALLAACEFIQVAAMAHKAAVTVGDRSVFVDFTKQEGESV